MARLNFKWKFALFFYLIILNVVTKSLPIGKMLPSSDTTNSNLDTPMIQDVESSRTNDTIEKSVEIVDEQNSTSALNMSRNSLIRSMRPGQEVSQYFVELTINGDSFEGRVVMTVRLTAATREDPIVLHIEDLDVNEVSAGIVNDANPVPADFDVDDGVIEITPARIANSYTVVIEYTGNLGHGGTGLHLGDYGQNTYLAMNLHPTNARRVFPCMDDPSESTHIAFKINGINYNHLVGNSVIEADIPDQFVMLEGPPHRWGFIAHSFDPINQPTTNVQLFGRSGVFQQEAMTSIAINFYFNNLNEWTDKDYFEIEMNQDGRMVILALPDVTETWHSLSVVGIWEPYLFMQTVHSVKQRSTALVEIGEAMARQWFSYVIFPVNWRYEWVNTGMVSYVTWELFRSFQESSFANDISLLDVNTLFVTEVIQESLLRDSFVTSTILEPDDDLLDEDAIRAHIHGLIKYKAPVIMKMLSTMLSDGETDYIQVAGRAMLNDASLSPVDTGSFVDGVNSQFDSNDFIDDIEEYLEQWLKNTGYPIVHVGLRQGGAFLTQERFSLSPVNQITYEVPITFTTSMNPNFDNLEPQLKMDSTTQILDFTLDEDDWVLLNIQGQGYYRVNYDFDLWERIIEALSDPESREEIHPLNRATLIDDSLNLARANKLLYEVAFDVVLTMEHEIEYAPWKAFVRNMDFLRKRLTAMVETDEDLDPDIYLRMVRRTIGMVEDEIGFYPDPLISEPAMMSLTRGLVMDHACRAKYDPCIAAAVDWFYDPNSNDPTVNPDIPPDIRPAVYCTMVREGGEDVIEALENRLEIEPTQYERIVIMEAMGCSADSNFISELLEETISPDAPYMVEERLRIYKSIVESSYDNVFMAIDFARRRTNEMREMYGGPHKLEEAIFHLAENLADADHAQEFQTWIFNVNNNLDDSQDNINAAGEYVEETLAWDRLHLESVYEWIDENSAPTLATSMLLICMTALMTLFNH